MKKKFLQVALPIVAVTVMLLGCSLPGTKKNTTIDSNLLSKIQPTDSTKEQINIDISDIDIPEVDVPEVDVPEINIETPEVTVPDVPVNDADKQEYNLEAWVDEDPANLDALETALGLKSMRSQYTDTYADIYAVATDNDLIVFFVFTADTVDEAALESGIGDQLSANLQTTVTPKICQTDVDIIFQTSSLYPDNYGFYYLTYDGEVVAGIEYTIDQILNAQ